MTLEPGDVLLVRGHIGYRHPFDDLIKLGESWQDHIPISATYSHCAVYIGDNTVVEAQGGRRSGKRSLNDYAGDYDIGHTHLSERDFGRLQWAYSGELDLPYDWMGPVWIGVGIITTLLHHPYWRPYMERRMRYCASFVNDAYALIGMELSDKRLPSPDDISRSPRLEIEHC